MLMPYQVTLVPNYLVSQWLGILNTPWSIILPGMFAPFSVFLLTKFMRRIPYSLIEAAKVDGAGEWEIFTKICLPQCRSAESIPTVLRSSKLPPGTTRSFIIRSSASPI